MSGVFPVGPIVDQDGRPTEAFAALLRSLIKATGGQWSIEAERVDDTHIRWTMKGSDGTKRATANDNLS